MGILVIGQNGVRAQEKSEPPSPGLWSRFIAALVKSRQRAAERELARLVVRYPQLVRQIRPVSSEDWKAAADALPF